ncbi:MAG TPA: MarR family transcriptional regulator [Xanthobacteraceae bacterium]|nr:MarR family transcriptional regulator [Xanthobacteraceae bacterium]
MRALKKPGSSARTVYLIRRVQFASYLRLEQAVGRHHLTTAQYMVLSMLGHRQPLSSADLSRRFSVKPQTMFKLISTLRRGGLVSLKSMNGDRRRLQLTLTRAGRRVLGRCEATVDSLEADLFRNFRKAQLAQFRRYLLKYLEDNP